MRLLLSVLSTSMASLPKICSASPMSSQKRPQLCNNVQQADTWSIGSTRIEQQWMRAGDLQQQQQLLASFQLWSVARLAAALRPAHTCDCVPALLLQLTQASLP